MLAQHVRNANLTQEQSTRSGFGIGCGIGQFISDSERRPEQPTVGFAEASQVAILNLHARDGSSGSDFRDWLSNFALGFIRSASFFAFTRKLGPVGC